MISINWKRPPASFLTWNDDINHSMVIFENQIRTSFQTNCKRNQCSQYLRKKKKQHLPIMIVHLQTKIQTYNSLCWTKQTDKVCLFLHLKETNKVCTFVHNKTNRYVQSIDLYRTTVHFVHLYIHYISKQNRYVG